LAANKFEFAKQTPNVLYEKRDNKSKSKGLRSRLLVVSPLGCGT